jgi:GT2 family glycosyltransferase
VVVRDGTLVSIFVGGANCGAAAPLASDNWIVRQLAPRLRADESASSPLLDQVRKLKLLLRPIYTRLPFLARIRTSAQELRRKARALVWNCSFGSWANDDALATLLARRTGDRPHPALSVSKVPLAISVVTYNSERWIQPFMDSLLAQAYPLNKLSLVFVDHGSADGTLEILHAIERRWSGSFAEIKIITQANIGFGGGHDRAMRSLSEATRFVLVANVDLEFRRESISRIIAFAAADAEDVAAWELRQLPFEHPKHYDPVTLECNWQSHACVLIRRTAYLQVGGYDRQIFMYGEDVELSYRFRSYGYRLRYVPSAAVYHRSYLDEGILLKPLQYTGSALASFLIRLRYGRMQERIAGLIMAVMLLLRWRHPVPNVRGVVARNFVGAIRSAPHFLRGRGPVRAFFPFRAFDFEMRRAGAAWAVQVPVATDRVSIITRTFDAPDRERLLFECARTVANQTYQNIEWVVVQDGPGDRAKAVLEKIAEFAPWLNVRFIECEKRGRSHAGNVGMAAATGRYCAFLDDDDLLYADHVEILVSALQRNPDAVAAYALAFEVLTRADASGRDAAWYRLPDIFQQAWDYEVLLDHNFIPIQAILFERQLFVECGGFELQLDQLEDWNLWLRYGAGRKFVYVPKTTSLFRTPATRAKRAQRHQALHRAYTHAKWLAIARSARDPSGPQDNAPPSC